METTLQHSKTLHLYRALGLELFSKNGYHNTSLDELCAELTMTKHSFIECFESKEDFFISIVQNIILQRTLNMLIEPSAFVQNPFPLVLEKLEVELEEAIESESNTGFLLANFISEFNTTNKRVNRHLLEILKIWEVNLVALLRKGQLDGFVKREVDCSGVANHIISSYMGIRTLMVQGNKRELGDQFLWQMRYYFFSISNTYTA